MTLATDQTKAYDAIMRWSQDGLSPFFVLGGYAGTGKTFLMQHLINNYDGHLVCCAPTGKAVDVLKSKLPVGTKIGTVHHLLYSPIETSTTDKILTLRHIIEDMKSSGVEPTDRLVKQLAKLEKRLEDDGDEEDVDFIHAPHQALDSQPLIICDESSMVTMAMFNDFMATGCRVLFVGDPFQLPPVSRDGDPDTRAMFDVYPPDFELTEIKRQALESPIVMVAHAVRHGQSPDKHFKKGHCIKVPRRKIEPEHALRADQVICATNKTRRIINRRSRVELGYSGEMPQTGDKMICVMNKNKGEWINGVLHECVGGYRDGLYHPVVDVLYEGELRENVEVYNFHLWSNYLSDDEAKRYKLNDWREKQMLAELDYGYAITCHKAQGSEWDKVLLIDDYWNKATKEYRRWLYTGITRASERLLWAA